MNDLSLSALPYGSNVFIDSNIFTYHLLGHKKYRNSVKDFLLKVESGIFSGYINEVIISEVDLGAVTDVLSMRNIQLIPEINISKVGDYMTKYNLLSADAIHSVSCKLHGIEHIATNDSDFERVDFLKLWVPGFDV